MSDSNDLSQVYFIITRTCNLFCSHCIRSSGPNVKDTVTLENAKLALSEIHKANQQPNLLISGGEPTLHQHFFEIVEYAQSLFENVTINTNGLNYKALQKIVKTYPQVMLQISIDGDQQTHNLIRGKNTFQNTMSNITKLYKDNAQIVIASTVGKSNIHSMSLLDEQLTEVPFKLLTIQREVIYGRASKSNALTTEEWNEFAQSTLHFKNAQRLNCSQMFALSSFVEDSDSIDVSKCNCSTGRAKMYINPDLTVFPCACLEEMTVGDLKTDRLDNILHTITNLPIEPTDGSPCLKCPAYEKCRGGCPGASYHTYGQMGIGDPRCPAIQDLVGAGYVE